MYFELIFWGIIFAVMVIVELASFQLISIWFAVGALGAFLVSLFTSATFTLQLIIFVVLSALLLILTRPILKKIIKPPIATNTELDIGKIAIIIEEVNNLKGTGRASLNGVDWSAISQNGEIIENGKTVKVEEINGSKLIVAIKNL
jgi:membrane protein implicated in regulation of membrane protease activity